MTTETEVKIVPMTPLLLDLKEAGKAMSLSDRTVWQMIQDGELRSIRYGTKHLVPVTEIMAYIARKMGPAPEGAAEESENPVDVESGTK